MRNVEQLNALLIPLAVAAEREQAHERAMAALCLAKGDLRCAPPPPHPFMLAVSEARQQREAFRPTESSGMVSTDPLALTSQALINRLRADLSTAHADNLDLTSECARLRERVRELERNAGASVVSHDRVDPGAAQTGDASTPAARTSSPTSPTHAKASPGSANSAGGTDGDEEERRECVS